MLFVTFSLLLMLGWTFAVNQLWPPQKKAPQAAPKTEDKATAHHWRDLPAAAKEALWLMGSPVPVGGFVVAGLAELDKLPPALPPIVKAAPKEPIKTVHMGGPRHHLEVTLTTLGAGVQQLVLNKFLAADWRGQPAPDKSKLQLIQDDPIRPSFLMYHYPDDKAERPEFTLADLVWKADSKEPTDDEDNQEMSFSARVPGSEHIKITKTYRLEVGAYHLGLSIKITDERRPQAGVRPEPSWFRYQLAGSHGMPVEGEWYTSTFRSAVIGMVDSRKSPTRDLETSDQIAAQNGGHRLPEGNLGKSFIQYAGVMNQYFASLIVTDDQQPEREDGSDARQCLAWARPTLETTEMPAVILSFKDDRITLGTEGKFIANYRMLPRVQKHLKDAGIKDNDRICASYYVDSDGFKVITWIRRGQVLRPSFDDITVRVNSQDINLKPGQSVQHNFLLYQGPAKVRLLSQFSGDKSVPAELVDRYAYTLNLRMMLDYGRFYWWSDLLNACTYAMHYLLYYLRFFGDGVSILLLTLLVRGLLFPVGRKQAYFSVKMQELAPEMKKIQEKFKNDPQGRTAATMEMYRKHNVHPLGGCLPLLLQMPIFISLYFALGESIFFRLAKFLWMDNLAAPDMLFYWGESIPLISDPDNHGGFLGFFYLGPYFNLLPIIAVTLMIVQQIVMTPPPQDEQQAMQFKMMRYMMIFIGIMFYKIAAGLCMYIIISTLWGLGERRLLPKKKPLAEQAAAAVGDNGARTGPSGRKQPPKMTPKKNEGIKKVSDWWQDVLKQARKK